MESESENPGQGSEGQTSKEKSKKKLRRRTLTKKEVYQIKRMLNIPAHVPFKKCPAKNRSALRRLAEKGETWHSDRKHGPCGECSCQNVAGYGTDHYGYGYCHLHERKQPKKECRVMAEADLRAQQQRHPRYFRNARDYLNKLEASEADKVQQFDLTEELEAARNVVSTIRTRVLEYEQTGADVLKETTALLNELVQTVKSGEWLEAGEKDRLIEAAETMVKKITCPLTERGSGGPVEMCDSTRYKLQLEAAKQLTEIAENVQKLQAITMITRESFVDWLKRFYRELKKEFGVMTYTRKEGTFLITEGVGEAMKNAGDPRRGL